MVVGVDFGTANVRVAVWDPNRPGYPEVKEIGKGGASFMPAVIAYQRAPGGHTSVRAVGEDADGLAGEPNLIVIRNIKRMALCGDPWVRALLEWRSEELKSNWDSWLNLDNQTVDLWGHSIPVENVINTIIQEALKRAGLVEMPEWRAGCPVHCGLSYRDMVRGVLSTWHGGNVSWITEEPLLFLALSYNLGRLGEGSYLLCDFGGGSFDCALATVERVLGDTRLTVYAAEGDPLLGGMDIDRRLAARLRYKDGLDLLRIAKEQACEHPSGYTIDIPGGFKLSYSDVEAVLREARFFERATQAILDVYHFAKLLWNRPASAPPIGDILSMEAGLIHKTVWQLRLHDLAADVDKVLLFGGSSKIPYVINTLKDIFGAGKVVIASKLLPGIRDPEITAAALGACYSAKERYFPYYIERLPARVTLRLKEESGPVKEISHIPYTRFPVRPPFAPYISQPLTRTWGVPATYQVTVEEPDGNTVHSTGWKESRLYGGTGGWANELKVIIDRFGRIWLDLITGKDEARLHDTMEILRMPPWQTGVQRATLERIWEQQRKHEESEQARTLRNLTRNPYGWGEDVG